MHEIMSVFVHLSRKSPWQTLFLPSYVDASLHGAACGPVFSAVEIIQM